MRPQTDRRTFLKSTLFGGCGIVVLRNSALVSGAGANQKLNIAIIGAGGQGGGNTNNVAGENIVAICDVDRHRAAGTFKRFANAKHFADFRVMLDKLGGRLDAAVVSTPDHTHAVAAIAAMKAGLHVYCEKPLARTVREAREMRLVAQKEKAVTQMGNQGSASEGLRRAVELAWAGVAGEIREAYVWFGGGNGPMNRPKEKPPVPPEVAWDLWLGPAPYRDYHPTYIRGRWRSWRAFGSGSAGDFGCHTMNMAFRGLRLERLWQPDAAGTSGSKATIRVEAEASEIDPEGYPRWAKVRYVFPARGDLPPVALTWSNGGPKPPAEKLMGHAVTGSGCLLVGTKGGVFSECPWNTRYKLLPEKRFEGFKGPERTLPRGPGHHVEWIRACKGGPKPFSTFDIGGPLTEVIQLGNAAVLIGHPFEYDPRTGTIVGGSDKDNSLLHREYRSGWIL